MKVRSELAIANDRDGKLDCIETEREDGHLMTIVN